MLLGEDDKRRASKASPLASSSPLASEHDDR
jgi:hypothetical protein